MESRINRSSIQCWFETQPTGCRKPHCVFLHKKPRSLALDEDQSSGDAIIRPVVAANASMDATSDGNCNDNPNGTPSGVNGAKRGEDVSQMKLFDDSDNLCQSVSSVNDSSTNHNITIEPISISLNDGDEESDYESTDTDNVFTSGTNSDKMVSNS
jgi:hypothetical protein